MGSTYSFLIYSKLFLYDEYATGSGGAEQSLYLVFTIM